MDEWKTIDDGGLLEMCAMVIEAAICFAVVAVVAILFAALFAPPEFFRGFYAAL